VSITPDALEFHRLISAGETVGWAETTAEPLFLTRLLDAQAECCPPFRVFFPLTFSNSFAAGHPNVTITALGGASAGRRFFAESAHNVVPANISDVPGLVADGRLPIDIVLMQVSGPDDAGRYNGGLGIEHLHAAIHRARLVIAQVNPELPWTCGDTVIEPGALDILVPAAEPPLELPARPPGPIERAIAERVARLIPDQATIELGLGAIPEAVTHALGSKRGLGVHSGAIGDGIADLMEAGIVDNQRRLGHQSTVSCAPSAKRNSLAPEASRKRSPRRLKPMGKADVGEKEGKGGRHRTFSDCAWPGFGAAGVQR
jgi:acyl-CoA hydrolase